MTKFGSLASVPYHVRLDSLMIHKDVSGSQRYASLNLHNQSLRRNHRLHRGGNHTRKLIKFQPSEVVKERVGDLIFRDKTGDLSTDEKAELDHFLMIEHILRLAKARTN